MKILVVGSGGREHAIAWRLAQDQEEHEIYCAPGNAGTLDVAVNVAIGAEDVELIAEWAKNEKPDLVVVGPEAPLVKGLVDELEKIGVPAFGPVAAGARMEGSKRFAKEIMQFINCLANTINNDPRVNDKLKVVFVSGCDVAFHFLFFAKT